MSICMRAIGLLGGLALWAGAVAAEEVYVVSPVFGVKPDGTCQEIKGGEFGAFKEKNLHWDKATKTVKLYAARNEEVAAQIVIGRQGKGFSGKMSELSGPGKIPGERATFSALIWIKGGSPDLVIPLDGSIKDIKTFDVPANFSGLPASDNKVGPMLFEVWVPKDAAAGTYKGTVSVLEGDKEIEKLNVELVVFDFALPDAPTFAFDLLDYGMPSAGLGAGATINSPGVGKPASKIPDKTKKMDYQVYKLAADNRCFVNALPYHSQRGSPRYAYPVAGQGPDAKVMSFEEYDDYFAPILDGKCNKYGQPPAHFTLPFNVNYPHRCESETDKQFDWMPFKNSVPDGPGKEAKLKEFEDTYKAIARQYADHFAEKGWTRTRFEIYYNQKSNKDRNRLPWKLDEPTDGPDYRGLGYLFNVGRWAFESAKDRKVQVVTRLDVGHFHCDKFLTLEGQPTKCYKSKQYDTADARKRLQPSVDHWVIGYSHAQSASHLIKEYEREGVKMMVYGTAGEDAVGKHLGDFAGECIKLARMRIVGRIVYKLDLMAGNPNSPGNDYVLYQGTAIGFEGALPCRRLKLWRDSVNSYEYIHIARKKNAEAADAILNKMTRTGPHPDEKYRNESKSVGYWFTNNVEDILRAKAKWAEIITGKGAPEVGEIEGFNDKYAPCGSPDKIVGYD